MSTSSPKHQGAGQQQLPKHTGSEGAHVSEAAPTCVRHPPEIPGYAGEEKKDIQGDSSNCSCSSKRRGSQAEKSCSFSCDFTCVDRLKRPERHSLHQET